MGQDAPLMGQDAPLAEARTLVRTRAHAGRGFFQGVNPTGGQGGSGLASVFARQGECSILEPQRLYSNPTG